MHWRTIVWTSTASQIAGSVNTESTGVLRQAHNAERLLRPESGPASAQPDGSAPTPPIRARAASLAASPASLAAGAARRLGPAAALTAALAALMLVGAAAAQAQTPQFSAAFTDGSGTRTVSQRLEPESFGIRVRITNGVTFQEEKTITVWYFPGTAQHFQDYNLRGLTATLPAGASTARITGLALVNDDLVETDETFEIAAGLDVDANGVLDSTDIASDRVALTIVDDDRQELVFLDGSTIVDEFSFDDDEGTAGIFMGTRSDAPCAVSRAFTAYVSYSHREEPYVTLPAENPFPVNFALCQRKRKVEIPIQDVAVLRDREVVFRIERAELDGAPFPRLVAGRSARFIVNRDPSVLGAATGADPYKIELTFSQPVHARHEHWQGRRDIQVSVGGVQRNAAVVRLACGPNPEPRCDRMRIEVATPIFSGQAVAVSYTGDDLRHRDGDPVEFTDQEVTNNSTAQKPRLGIERIGSGNVAEGGIATYEIRVESGGGPIWAVRPDTPPGITSYRDYGIPVNVEFAWNDGTSTSSGNPSSAEFFVTGSHALRPGTVRWAYEERIPDNGAHCDTPLTIKLAEHEGDWYTISTTSATTGEITIVDGGDTHSCGTSGQGAILPVVSVTAGAASAVEGATLSFTVSRDGTAGDLAVDLDVSETGAMLGAYATRTVIPDGSSSHTVDFLTVDDETDEADSVVTVELAGDGEETYEVGEPASASVTVEDDDEGGKEAATRTAALTASLSGAPESHDGQTRFGFELRFSEEFPIRLGNLRDHAFEVSGGRMRRARRLSPPSNVAWRMTVEPDSAEAVAVTLRGDRPCGEQGAMCTGDGRRLSNSPSLRVAGPPVEPLTASFEEMPAAHDGERFTFGLTFSEEPKVSYRTLRDHAFAVGGGKVRSARRRQQGSDRRWTITVEPSGFGAVSIRLPETGSCSARGAICTADGRPLSHSLSATVRAPVGIAVADARVDENAGALLAFAVTLSRAASGSVTVDYATANGSATAGDDYTAASGTLRFGAGESSKTVEVGVLDDAHDEGEETFTLVLSNASGGRVTDGEATGTIVNRDPLPRALLARFGRTAAVHVVEHVEERMEAPREPGFRGAVAGRELRPGMARDVALQFLGRLGGAAGAQAPGGAHTPLAGPGGSGAGTLGTPGLSGGGMGMPGAGGLLGGGGLPGGAATGGAAMLPGAAGAPGGAAGPGGGMLDGGLYALGLGGDELLTGSSFALNRETGHGGILSFWSRGARSSFQGREGALSLGGDVRTTMFGADYAKGPLVVGLSLARSQGLGDYAGTAAGRVASAVTGLYPWLGYQLNERVSVWGVTGYGTGGLLLTPAGGPALESGLSMKMTAAGTRGELVAGGAGGFGLAFKADALWVGTASEGVEGPAGRMAATAAAVTRFRTGLEGSRAYTPGGRLSLKPVVEVGLRHDGGDAETGAGMDVGAGLVVSDAGSGLAVDVRVRTLLVHQDEDFRERGIAVSLSYNPTPQTPLGFTAKVAPSWGGQATSGAEALWGRETMAGMAHGSFGSGNRLDGEVGYGLPVGSRFVGTPRVGFTTSDYGRDYRVGYALGVLENEGLTFQLGFDAQRRESPMLGGASNGLLGRASVGW